MTANAHVAPRKIAMEPSRRVRPTEWNALILINFARHLIGRVSLERFNRRIPGMHLHTQLQSVGTRAGEIDLRHYRRVALRS